MFTGKAKRKSNRAQRDTFSFYALTGLCVLLLHREHRTSTTNCKIKIFKPQSKFIFTIDSFSPTHDLLKKENDLDEILQNEKLRLAKKFFFVPVGFLPFFNGILFFLIYYFHSPSLFKVGTTSAHTQSLFRVPPGCCRLNKLAEPSKQTRALIKQNSRVSPLTSLTPIHSCG